MAEKVTLTVPVTRPSVTDYIIGSLHLDWSGSRIDVTLLGSDGSTTTASYTGATALTLMSALNTANLSVTSLHKRVVQRLQTDGLLGAGSISGTPA